MSSRAIHASVKPDGFVPFELLDSRLRVDGDALEDVDEVYPVSGIRTFRGSKLRDTSRVQNPWERLDMTKKKPSAEAAVREIRRRTRRKFAPEEKVRIVLEGLRGEQSISELCRREGIAANLYYRWSKDFLEAGKKAAGRGHRPGSHQ